MWPDNETATDLLGFDVHANLLRAVITEDSMLPLTIGVFGDWGGGKTSIMKMLEKSLNPDTYAEGSSEHSQCTSIATVYVNTWQFEGYDDAKAALISAVLMELKDHKRFGPKVRDHALTLLRSVNWLRFGRLTLKHVAVPAAAAFFTGGAAAIPAALALSTGLSQLVPAKEDAPAATKKDESTAKAGDWPDLGGVLKEDASKETAMDVRAFRAQFSALLKDGGIKTLVVLVDDLDRCTPERLLENLEAIKLFLAVDHTAFVIGADPRIVEHAIRFRYAERATHNIDKSETDRLVIDYLEKLVQLPYTLPRLSPSEIESYMALLFCQKHLASDGFKTCLAKCDANRLANRYQTFGFGEVHSLLGKDVVQGDFAAALQFCATAAPAIAEGLKGNPRQVKRFLNAFLLRKQLAQVARLEDIRDDVLIKLMILEYAHLDRFRELFDWQSADNGFPKALNELEAGLDSESTSSTRPVDQSWGTPPLRKWLAMEPRLSKVDLRNYFWVARDRLASTFGGVSLVPPAIRRVFEDALSDGKRRTAAQTAVGLGPDERATLFSLFEQHVVREPDNAAHYEALRFFIDSNVPGAPEAYARCLIKADSSRIPPGVATNAVTLLQSKPAVKPALEPAIIHLRGQKGTRAGTAVEKALAPRKA
jgi:KAP family P-loop domain